MRMKMIMNISISMNISMRMKMKMKMRSQSVRPVGLAALNLIQTLYSIGSKNFKIYSHVVPKVYSFALLPPNDPPLGNDNAFPIWSPNASFGRLSRLCPTGYQCNFFFCIQ